MSQALRGSEDLPLRPDAQGAFPRGNGPTIVADACAMRPLQTTVAEVSAEQVHHSAPATIDELYGVVIPSTAWLN